jgi:hypothetical protein
MHGSRTKTPIKISFIYIYDVKFLALLGASYIYDISRLRVNGAIGGGCLRHCAASGKVAGSISDCFNRIFY